MSEHGEIMQRSASVGRIVHYARDHETPRHRCVAAIVTGVHPDESRLALTVFGPGEDPDLALLVRFSDDNETGTWHWPEQV